MLPRSSGRVCSFSSISILFPSPFSSPSLHTVSRHPHELQIVFVLQLEAVNRCWGPLQQHLRTWVCVCVCIRACVCVWPNDLQRARAAGLRQKKRLIRKSKINQSAITSERDRIVIYNYKSLGALYYAHTSTDLRTHSRSHTHAYTYSSPFIEALSIVVSHSRFPFISIVGVAFACPWTWPSCVVEWPFLLSHSHTYSHSH